MPGIAPWPAVPSCSLGRVVLGISSHCTRNTLQRLDLGLLRGGDLGGQLDECGVGGPVGHHRRQLDGLLVVRNHVGGEAWSSALKPGGLRVLDGFLRRVRSGVVIVTPNRK